MTLASPYTAIVAECADRYELDEALVWAVLYTESSGDRHALSAKGAKGLMQLMPNTAKRFGVRDRSDPYQNIMGGCRYLRTLLDLFGDDLERVLAAYNAGETAVLRYRGIPPYPETQRYVRRVLQRLPATVQTLTSRDRLRSARQAQTAMTHGFGERLTWENLYRTRAPKAARDPSVNRHRRDSDNPPNER